MSMPSYGQRSDPRAAPECPRHPGVRSVDYCKRCNRPMCVDCAIPTEVRSICVDCTSSKKRWMGSASRAAAAGTPVVTYAMIAICVLMYAVTSFAPSTKVDLALLPATLMSRPWTVLTGAFLHGGIMHILFNMLTLWCVGPVLERMMGHWPYLALYLLSGLGGGAGLMVWAVCSPSGWMTAAYGASGALFGLFAAILVVYRRIGIDIRSMLIWMLINFLMPVITPGIAWQAHVGGFIVGGVLAWLLVTGLHAFRGKSLTWRTTVYGITVFVVVVAIIVGCNAGNPLMHMSLLYQ